MTKDEWNQIKADLAERLHEAEADAASSSKASMNSYGAGYDRGFADALSEILSKIS